MCVLKSLLPSLHHTGQIHALVKGTIEVIDSCDGKWPDLPIPSCDINVAKDRCSRLSSRVRCAILVPHPILQHMLDRTVINNEQFRAFGNQDDVLNKMIQRHMDDWLSVRVGACRTSLRIHRNDERDNEHADHDASKPTQ